jgi:hypothetical protein
LQVSREWHHAVLVLLDDLTHLLELLCAHHVLWVISLQILVLYLVLPALEVFLILKIYIFMFVGDFVNYTGAAICDQCVPGKFIDVEGSTACQDCLSGFFSNTSRSISCHDCSIGTYSPRNASTVCTLCELGRFTAILRSTTCMNCTFGRFGSIRGLADCPSCSPGNQLLEIGFFLNCE